MHSELSQTSAIGPVGANAAALQLYDGAHRRGHITLASASARFNGTAASEPHKAAISIARACISALRMDMPGASRMLVLGALQCSRTKLEPGTRTLADLVSSLSHLVNDGAPITLSLGTAIRQSTCNPVMGYVATVLCRAAHWLAGDIEAFDGIGRVSPPPGVNHHASLATLLDRSVEAAVSLQQLRLPMAARLSRDVLAAVARGRNTPAISLLPAIILAQLSYERGDLIEADAAVRAVLPRIRACGTVETSVRAYTTLARSAVRRGHCEFALTMLREGEALGAERAWPRLVAACLAEKIDMFCALGRNEDAKAAFDRLVLLPRPHQDLGRAGIGVELHLELARCRILANGVVPGLETALIRRLLSDALSRGDRLFGTQLAVRLIAALMRAGDQKSAAETAMNVVTVGCDSGLHQTILDGDVEVKEVLRLIRPTLAAPYLQAYVATLLDHWPDVVEDDTLGTDEKRSEGILTPRERGVLQLMGLGLSNKRIAQRLGIAPETVKSHAKNIFVRLGSATRAEAVSRSASLGLI